jgi:predicted DsbA family dithiol-disulfide isomerase
VLGSRPRAYNFDFDAIKVAPNTLDAHRVIRWAGGNGQRHPERTRAANCSASNFEQGQEYRRSDGADRRGA